MLTLECVTKGDESNQFCLTDCGPADGCGPDNSCSPDDK